VRRCTSILSSQQTALVPPFTLHMSPFFSFIDFVPEFVGMPFQFCCAEQCHICLFSCYVDPKRVKVMRNNYS
jgi:hypothetical protein